MVLTENITAFEASFVRTSGTKVTFLGMGLMCSLMSLSSKDVAKSMFSQPFESLCCYAKHANDCNIALEETVMHA